MRLILRRAGQGGSSSRGDFSILAQLEIEKNDIWIFLKDTISQGKSFATWTSSIDVYLLARQVAKNKSHLKEAEFFAITNFANIEKMASGP